MRQFTSAVYAYHHYRRTEEEEHAMQKDDDDNATGTELMHMTTKDLRDLAASHGLSTKGNKADLVHRIEMSTSSMETHSDDE